MDKRGETSYERIVKVLQEANRPLQTKEFQPLLRAAGSKQSYSAMTTMLCHFCNQRRLYRWKATGIPTFYALPGWMRANRKNELNFKFDPYTKTRLDEPENNTV
jgi:hypothetical protein